MNNRSNITIRGEDINKLLTLTENEVKVYLAIRSGCSTEEIAQIISSEEKNVLLIQDRLKQLKLLERKKITGIQQIMQEAGTNEDFAVILNQAQKFQKRDLAPRQIVELYAVMDLGIDTEALLHTMVMLREKKKYSEKYFVKVAETMKNNHILHMEDLQKETDIRDKNIIANIVASEFGINRTLTPVEIKYIKKWEEYNFNPESPKDSLTIIKRACEKTVLLTGKVSFPYCDSMLRNWLENNVRNLEDVAALERYHIAKKKQDAAKVENKGKKEKQNAYGNPKPNKFHNFEQRETDYDALVYERLQEMLNKPGEDV